MKLFTLALIVASFPVFCSCNTAGTAKGSSTVKADSDASTLPAMTLDASVHATSDLPMPRNGSYLAMGIPFAPVANLHDQVVSATGKELITRGEAHITVIEPPEFAKLKRFVSMADLQQLAQEGAMQSADFTVDCLGRGIAQDSNNDAETFFVVVASPGLLDLRAAIGALYKSRGGDEGDFDAGHFTPHITVGFTERDLFEQDGVTKDHGSCVADLHS